MKHCPPERLRKIRRRPRHKGGEQQGEQHEGTRGGGKVPLRPDDDQREKRDGRAEDDETEVPTNPRQPIEGQGQGHRPARGSGDRPWARGPVPHPLPHAGGAEEGHDQEEERDVLQGLHGPDDHGRGEADDGDGEGHGVVVLRIGKRQDHAAGGQVGENVEKDGHRGDGAEQQHGHPQRLDEEGRGKCLVDPDDRFRTAGSGVHGPLVIHGAVEAEDPEPAADLKRARHGQMQPGDPEGELPADGAGQRADGHEPEHHAIRRSHAAPEAEDNPPGHERENGLRDRKGHTGSVFVA